MKLARIKGLLLAATLLVPNMSLAQDIDASTLSGADMAANDDQAIIDMEVTLSEAQGLYDLTNESDGDIAKLRCINDKIASMQGFIRLAEGARSALDDRTRVSDREGMEHQYTMIEISRGRVQNLLARERSSPSRVRAAPTPPSTTISRVRTRI